MLRKELLSKGLKTDFSTVPQERRKQQADQGLPPGRSLWLLRASHLYHGGGAHQPLPPWVPGPVQRQAGHPAPLPRLQIPAGTYTTWTTTEQHTIVHENEKVFLLAHLSWGYTKPSCNWYYGHICEISEGLPFRHLKFQDNVFNLEYKLEWPFHWTFDAKMEKTVPAEFVLLSSILSGCLVGILTDCWLTWEPYIWRVRKLRFLHYDPFTWHHVSSPWAMLTNSSSLNFLNS